MLTGVERRKTVAALQLEFRACDLQKSSLSAASSRTKVASPRMCKMRRTERFLRWAKRVMIVPTTILVEGCIKVERHL